MTLFGLDESEVTSLAARVRGPRTAGGPGNATGATGARSQADRGAADTFDSASFAGDIFARAAWTGIAEPGDGMAGLLVACLGASTALSTVLDGWAAVRLAAAVHDAGTNATEELPNDLDQALARWRPRLSSAAVIRSLRQAERVTARLMIPGDMNWPAGVDDLGLHAPLALWWRGVPAALTALGHSIALVGARAATGYGEHVAMESAAGLVERGFAIVSGAAYGIDGMAHRAALASEGFTIAFLAGGVDRFYPSGHDTLLTRIAQAGAVVSELPCGVSPTKWRFLQRNRLIAASSSATVVLEAGWRSGSLNTAGHAAALGRPLGAVPGPVTSPTSAGCHRLIREYDAACVTNAAEMAELLGELTQAEFDLSAGANGVAVGDGAVGGGRTSEQIRVVDALSARSPRSVFDIARRAGMSTSAVLGALGALDFEGIVREKESGWVRGERISTHGST